MVIGKRINEKEFIETEFSYNKEPKWNEIIILVKTQRITSELGASHSQ